MFLYLKFSFNPTVILYYYRQTKMRISRDSLTLSSSIAIIVMLVAVFSGSSAELLNAEDEQRLVSFVKNLMECRNIPGLTMTIVKGIVLVTFAITFGLSVQVSDILTVKKISCLLFSQINNNNNNNKKNSLKNNC